MIKRYAFWVIAAFPVVLTACSRRADIGYRVGIAVNDRGKIRKGSGIWRTSIKEEGFPNPYVTHLIGDAIPVDMGDKGMLYVLTVARNPKRGWPTEPDEIMTYGRDLFGEVARLRRGESVKGLGPLEQIRELQRMVGQKASLDCTHLAGMTRCPFMVRFRDENDPTTVEAVDPANLAATYGLGVSLLPIEVQLTDDNPTDQGMSRRLTWASRPQQMALNGEMLQRGFSLPAMIKTSAFTTVGK